MLPKVVKMLNVKTILLLFYQHKQKEHKQIQNYYWYFGKSAICARSRYQLQQEMKRPCS